MTLSMYAASVPPFRTRMEALGGVLDKSAAFAAERGLDVAALLQSRLAPDMFPLVRQVQLASDHAKGGPARLAGVQAPRFADEETSFPELKDRIARTVAYLDTLTPAQIDGSEGKEIVLKTPHAELRFTGQQYLLGFVIPNLLFHCTIAYGLLRQAGVTLGKRDFIGAV